MTAGPTGVVWLPRSLVAPEIAAKLCAYINYISPVDGIRPILEKSEPEIAENTAPQSPADIINARGFWGDDTAAPPAAGAVRPARRRITRSRATTSSRLNGFVT